VADAFEAARRAADAGRPERGARARPVQDRRADRFTGGTPAGARNRGVVVACVVVLVSAWNITNIGAVASEVAHAYGVSLATVGLLTAALVLTHTAVQIPAGKASDRFGAAHRRSGFDRHRRRRRARAAGARGRAAIPARLIIGLASIRR
jgi:MFS family permease